MEIGMSDGMRLNDTSLTGVDPVISRDPVIRQDPPAPDESGLDAEMREFLAEGYIMSPTCFGSSSTQYADQLMEFINNEYSDQLYYQTLTRRATTSTARKVFKSIAASQLDNAKRFAAAYFLITGKRYFPTRTTIEPVVVPTSYLQALRQGYMSESQDAVKYRIFSQQVADRCLKRIAEDISNTEKKNSQDILGLIQIL
jgi:rubrerythrin